MRMRSPFRYLYLYLAIRRARSGQTAIIVALGMVLLMSCTALAVDGARFYAEGLRVQKAADEAALAAVVQFSTSGDVAGQARANDIATRNLPGTSVTVLATSSNSPVDQEKVVVTEPNFSFLFAPIFGLKSAQVTREAKAQYNAPVPMGNPSNTLGYPSATIDTYQPGTTGVPGTGSRSPVQQNLTLSVNGPDQWFESGDPYSPLYLLSDPPFITRPAPIKNPYYPQNPNGYDYKVTIPSGSSGATYIQVYDAETCHQDAMGDTVVSGQYGLPNANGAVNVDGGDLNKQATYFRLYRVDPSTGQNVSVSGSPLLARGPAGGSYPSDVVIAPTAGVSAWTTCDAGFRDKWYTLAKVDATQGGSYIVNVTTCLNPNSTHPVDMYNSIYKNMVSGLGSYYCRGAGVNNFALRAITTGGTSAEQVNCDGSTSPPLPSPSSDPLDCQTISPNSSTPPSVAGVGRISIQVQSPGTSLIYLAKVDPIYAGKWLLVKLFDPGDLAGASSMQIVRPDGSYAPFMWYTETLNGDGNTFQTALRNIGTNTSLITSFPPGSIPNYSAPTAGCPSLADSSLSPSGAKAYGQTVAEDNPFDPSYQTAACVGANDAQPWSSQNNRPLSPPWLDTSNAYKGYNLSSEWTQNNCQRDGTQPNTGTNSCQSNYRVYNGRWVYIFTQIPSNYATDNCANGSAVAACSGGNGQPNPNPGWWYIQYKTSSSNAFTDRTTWETAIIDTPPHLIQ